MFKKSKIALILAMVLAFSMSLVGCNNDADKKDEATTEDVETTDTNEEATEPEEEEETEVADENAPGGGFEEFDIGDEQEVGPLIVAGVYFQPVDMEPAGNSIPKEDADCHIEADIAASEEGTNLGYGVGDFIPWLQVKALIQKEGSDQVDEVAFMPMNASDGPHYGANYKFPEGLGKYSVKFEISAPGNDYLLHVDEETGVSGRFWTEPIVVEWPDFEWAGPQW